MTHDSQLTALLLVGESYSDQTLFYKTRFLAGDPFIYIERDGRRTLVVSSMERGRAEKESSVPEVRSFDDFGYRDLLRELKDRGRAFTAVLGRIVRESGAERLAVKGSFPALYADYLRAEGFSIDIDPQLLVRQRRAKGPEEIEAIEEAQRATERAAGRAVEMLAASEERGGVLYLDGEQLTSEALRSEIEVTLLRDGVDSAHSPIVAAGPGAADPHWSGDGPIRAGQAVVLDIFPRSKRTRYCADMTRTVVKGDPGPELRSMHQAVLEAQEAALARVRAGASGRSVHEAVQAVFARRGFSGGGPGPRYLHGTGHGVGLDLHEAPHVGDVDEELVENDVVTIEPGLYAPAVGAVRIEDLVVVTRDGYRNLTRFPKGFEL